MHAIVLLLAAATASAQAPQPPAEKPLPQGVIRLDYKSLHCAGCARQVGRNLYKTPGVVRVRANLKQNRVWVNVQPKKQMDLAQVWQAAHTKDAQPAALRIGAKRFVAKDFVKEPAAGAAQAPAGAVR